METDSTDFAGLIEQKYHLMITIDAYSKWAEAFVFMQPPTSENTIDKFEEMFSFQGL